MKIIVRYIVMIMMMFIIVSCGKNGSSDPASSSIQYYTVSGIVYDATDKTSSPGYAKGVRVAIDKDTTLSDSQGLFIFSKITEGSHTISTSSARYETFSKTISVPTTTYLRIDLVGVKDDYFPITD